MRLPVNLTMEVTSEEAGVERNVLEILRERADLLVGRDRALALLYLEYGSNFSQIAQLTGRGRSAVGRRIRRIIARLCDETYHVCAQRGRFSRSELAIVKEHSVRGLSVRRIARKHNLCVYRVRKVILQAERLAEAWALVESATRAEDTHARDPDNAEIDARRALLTPA